MVIPQFDLWTSESYYKYHGIPDRAKIPAQKILLGNVVVQLWYTLYPAIPSMLQHHSSLVHLS